MATQAARDVMLPGVSLHIKDRGSTLVKKLLGKYHALPVVNDDHEVVGIVSEQNILDALEEKKTIFECSATALMRCGHAKHVRCATPVAVSPDTPLHDVIKTIFREQLSTLPVVENRKLVGIIHRKNIL
jgi:CBS domain-containing protein